MSDLAKSEQLASRDWHKRIEVAGRALTAPGVPYRMTGTPCTAHRSASARGADTRTVFAPDFAWANRAAERVAVAGGANGRGGPLAGLRVIEVTANWAGPIAGRHLADLGADVLKVELQTKPATRALVYTGGDVWPDFYHRSAYFNKLNRNKRAMALDLSKPQGREVFLRLVRDADIVIENNGARVMGQLGLAYGVLREVNPAIVMCSMSGYGGTGPERNYAAYGSNIETASGLASVNGYGPGEYFGTGSFYADPVTGTHGSAAILAALHHARRTGRGQWIDMSLLEAVGPFFAQEFLEYAVTGHDPEPIGNRSKMYAPQGVYPAAGTDCWPPGRMAVSSCWSRTVGSPPANASPAFSRRAPTSPRRPQASTRRAWSWRSASSTGNGLQSSCRGCHCRSPRAAGFLSGWQSGATPRSSSRTRLPRRGKTP